MLQNWSLTIRWGLVSYSGVWLGKGPYPSAEVLSAYSTTPGDMAIRIKIPNAQEIETQYALTLRSYR